MAFREIDNFTYEAKNDKKDKCELKAKLLEIRGASPLPYTREIAGILGVCGRLKGQANIEAHL